MSYVCVVCWPHFNLELSEMKYMDLYFATCVWSWRRYLHFLVSLRHQLSLVIILNGFANTQYTDFRGLESF